METGASLYETVEKTFWNSLTKKLSSFLLLFVIDLVYVAIYLDRQSEIDGLMKAGQVSAETAAQIMGSMQQGLYLMLVLTLIGLCINVGQIVFIRHLIVRPVKIITGIFNEIARGEGDFSRDLPLVTHDELRELAQSYNLFAEKMRQIINDVRMASVNIARDAVLVKSRVEQSARDAQSQGQMTEVVFTASVPGEKLVSA